MFNFDDLISSAQMYIDQLQNDIISMSEVQQIHDELSNLIERLGNSIDSYNSSYVSLSTYNNDGTESTSAERMKAAYSPVRAKLMVMLQMLESRITRVKSNFNLVTLPNAYLSIMQQGEAGASDVMPVLKPTLDGLQVVTYRNVRNFLFETESNAQVYGRIPILNINSDGDIVRTDFENYNAGQVANHTSDGSLSLSRNGAAIAARYYWHRREGNQVVIDSFAYRFILIGNARYYLQLEGDNLKLYFTFTEDDCRAAAGIALSGMLGRAKAIQDVVNTLLATTATRIGYEYATTDPIDYGGITFTPIRWKTGLLYSSSSAESGENNSFGYGSYLQSWSSADASSVHLWTTGCGGNYYQAGGDCMMIIHLLETLTTRMHSILQTPSNS